ncbi:MAG: hypothetical protein M3Y09_02955, partial [Actinomycetota bacterium]|nr:hypothetical protein [Actinomycetota bacterium]
GAVSGSRLVRQVGAYLSDQQGRLVGEVRGALVLLVPSYRKPDAEAVLRALENQADDPNASTPLMSDRRRDLG